VRLVWSPRARGDLQEIRQYLNQRSPKGAQRILARIIRRVSDQRDMPLAAPIERDGPERCLVISRTPYLVLYTVEGDVMTIVAVYHAMRSRR
jgi:toxin ParE1/3/4